MVYGPPYVARRLSHGIGIPWTLQLLLGAHSRKHILRPFSFKAMGTALNDLGSRIAWALNFRDDHDHKSECPLVKRLPLECKRVLPSKVTAFLSALKRSALDVRRR
jgi:hypothetical protein